MKSKNAFFFIPSPSSSSLSLNNPAAANHFVAAIEDCGLAWSDGALRFVETDVCAVVLKRRNGCERSRVTIADADFGANRSIRIIEGNPVDACGCELVAQ